MVNLPFVKNSETTPPQKKKDMGSPNRVDPLSYYKHNDPLYTKPPEYRPILHNSIHYISLPSYLYSTKLYRER